MMSFQTLLEKSSDTDLLREMIGWKRRSKTPSLKRPGSPVAPE
jgi:hypothetical protein